MENYTVPKQADLTEEIMDTAARAANHAGYRYVNVVYPDFCKTLDALRNGASMTIELCEDLACAIINRSVVQFRYIVAPADGASPLRTGAELASTIEAGGVESFYALQELKAWYTDKTGANIIEVLAGRA